MIFQPTAEITSMTEDDKVQGLVYRSVVVRNRLNRRLYIGEACQLVPRIDDINDPVRNFYYAQVEPTIDDSPTFVGIVQQEIPPGGYGEVATAGVLCLWSTSGVIEATPTVSGYALSVIPGADSWNGETLQLTTKIVESTYGPMGFLTVAEEDTSNIVGRLVAVRKENVEGQFVNRYYVSIRSLVFP